MIDDTPSPRDEELALWLWACDEAIAGGRPLPPAPGGAGQPLGREEIACLQLLDGLRGRPQSSAAVLRPAAEDPPHGSDFLAVVRESGLIDPEPLDDFIRRTRAGNQTSPADLADRLVRDKHLTRYQAERLLAGDRGLLLSGRYRILDRLGAGGMGEVYLCAHAVMKHKVAIKVLPPGRSNDAALDGFRREARAVAALDHPNIVRAFDIASDGPTHYLVMEYIEGRTLQAVVKAEGPLDVTRAVGYVAQVAAALQHAHERGMVHRDVKPANLIVDETGTVKVLDLGLARFFRADERPPSGEDPDAVVGTADYMAPEQCLDGPAADTRADIYSLGCTLYYLLTGKAPFEDKSVPRKLICHQFRKPEPLRTVRPDIPENLVAVIERMTAKDPVDRYQTPAEVTAALRPWTAANAAPPAPPPVARRFRAVRATVGAFAVTGCVGGLAWLYGSSPVPSDPVTPQPTTVAIADGPELSIDPSHPEELREFAKQLKALNWQFDGRVSGRGYRTPDGASVDTALRIEGGRVKTLSISVDRVTDIEPIRRLTGLEQLVLRRTEGDTKNTGLLGDLGPLKGLKLKFLDCSRNIRLVNLEPLRGMPLEELYIGGTRVRDLSPLEGSPLRKLNAGSSGVYDLTPLRGLPVRNLSVRNTGVDNLEPLRGAPLEALYCEKTRVRDLSPLAGSPLRFLNCQGTRIESFAPLAGCPLEELYFDYDPQRDANLMRMFPGLKRINKLPAAEFWATLSTTIPTPTSSDEP